MNSSRLVPTATLLPSGRVLIAGGKAADASVLNSTELYDPAANTFTTAAAMNTARYSATATLLPNGKVLIAGGLDSSFKPLASTELYDPVNNTFLAADPAVMNTARNTATATLLSNGKVLIAGGLDTSGSALASTDLYDPANNTFLAADPATMNTARSSATATLLPNGKVLIAGGQGGGVIGLASTELYNPANNTFLASDPATMTSGRAVATATLLTSGDVLIAGGFVISGDNNLTSTERYITATNTFLTSGNPTMNTARNAAMATLLPNGKVLIAGGDRSPPSVSRAPSCTIRSSTASHPPLS